MTRLNGSLTALGPPRSLYSDLRPLRRVIEGRLKTLAGARGEAPHPGNGQSSKSDILGEAVRYTLLAPGKRIRPILAVLCAREFGLADTALVDPGCALEMVHAASLALDDLPSMDDAVSRRGQPATHVVFGEDVAILASITLLSRAYGTLAQAPDLDPETRCALVAILARAVGSDGLASGQYRDLRVREGADADGIMDANHLKTGMLFVAAVEMAAAAARIGDTRLDRMRRFAGHMGQAFQLLDDLTDGQGGGFPLGAAEDDGKATLLSILGRSETRRRLDHHVARALDDLSPAGDLAGFVKTLFGDHVTEGWTGTAAMAASL